MSSERVRLDVEQVIRESGSGKALLVVVDDREVWVPKSVIDDDSECYSTKSGPGVMIVPEWWARQNGLD